MSARIHFYLRTDRPTKDGSVQVYLIFIINKHHRLKFNTGKYIPLKKEYKNLSAKEIQQKNDCDNMYCWDKKKERAIKGTGNWESINHYLDAEKAKANEIIIRYQLMNKPITVDLFRQAYLKKPGTNKFKEYFTQELDVKRKHLLANNTFRGYKAVISKVNTFRPNLSLTDIDFKFLSQFENHMVKPVSEGGLGNGQNTVCKTMKMLRALIIIAIKNEDFPKEAYPFKDYKIKHVDPVLTTRDYLEPEDLMKVEQLLSPENISKLTEGEVKATKRFLFSCYTGLRYSDVNTLSRKEHIFGKWVLNPKTNEMTYRYYIELKMTKTSHPVFIPLIDKAIELMQESKGDLVFEQISNQKLNKHLKSINKKAGLNKKLSFHVARHSFATICFLYEIPEKVGQKLLGHKNRRFTEVYTHLSQNKLFYEMDKLNRGLSQFQVMVEDSNSQKSSIKEMLPMMQNLSSEKLDQLKGLLKLLGS